ncbi:helix-turn-helix domain-containing protein [Aestuariivita sp.]|uniref:helix-turn-helix domain-containing protein n=1 Tax=Aestuariivita sp. TaxID=1872407 RepID=UPI003BAE8935
MGPRIRKLRTERGHSREQMAIRLGISKSYLSQLERNSRPVSMAVLVKLLETYRIDLKQFSDHWQAAALEDLVCAFEDPVFQDLDANLKQFRLAVAQCPDLVTAFLRLYEKRSNGRARKKNGTVPPPGLG